MLIFNMLHVCCIEEKRTENNNLVSCIYLTTTKEANFRQPPLFYRQLPQINFQGWNR